MKRKLYFVAICIFMLLAICGCSNTPNYYFKFVGNSYNIQVGDSVEISAIPVKTNLTNFTLEVASADNTNVEITNGKLLTGVEQGETIIKVVAKNKDAKFVVKLKINVVPAEQDTGDNNSNLNDNCLNYNLSTVVADDYAFHILTITLNNEPFYNFTFEVKENTDCNISNQAKVFNRIEITSSVVYNFQVKIVNTLNPKDIVLVNLNSSD